MKLTIVGTGNVGSALAYVVALEGLADDLVLVNRDKRKARGHALDLQHTVSMTRKSMQIRGGSIDDSAGSDVVVMTMSVPMDREKPDRRKLAEGNASILKEWIPQLAAASPDAVFLIVTNPVDSMTWACLQLTDLPPERVCGIGTIVDSARFRALMSQELNIHPDDIRAYVLGEHGASQVAAISVATVAGVHFQESIRKAHEIAEETIGGGIEIFELKGFTNFAVAKATAVVIEAIQQNQQRTVPLSVLLNGYGNIRDVCLSIPVVVGRSGVSQQLYPSLTDAELEAFRQSATAVKETNARIMEILKS